VKLRSVRLVQVLGLLVAAAGLAGYWFSRDPAVTAPLGQAEAALVNPEGEAFQASFVVAGRDILYTQAAGDVLYDAQGRVIGRSSPARANAYGTNTDSIFYVNVVGDKVYMIAIPRDVYLPEHQIKINAVVSYRHLGVDGLRQEVSKLLGLPVQYYAIINIDIFERLVDALGGVEVIIPQAMKHDDWAAGLHIDFAPGVRHLDGQDAAKFVRYRKTLPGEDLGRIDNIKRLGSAMLAKVRQLNLRAAVALPELAATLFDEVETNADPAIMAQLLRRLTRFEIIPATLPGQQKRMVLRGDPLEIIEVDPAEVESFLAQTFGGEARSFQTVPEATLIISNRSGVDGLEDVYKARLVRAGVPEERIVTQRLSPNPLPTHLQAELAYWDSAAYYASMLHIERAQVYRVNRLAGAQAGLELVLGEDATALSDFAGLGGKANY
jgi:LCP family protein required for cell wall assembly